MARQQVPAPSIPLNSSGAQLHNTQQALQQQVSYPPSVQVTMPALMPAAEQQRRSMAHPSVHQMARASCPSMFAVRHPDSPDRILQWMTPADARLFFTHMVKAFCRSCHSNTCTTFFYLKNIRSCTADELDPHYLCSGCGRQFSLFNKPARRHNIEEVDIDAGRPRKLRKQQSEAEAPPQGWAPYPCANAPTYMLSHGLYHQPPDHSTGQMNMAQQAVAGPVNVHLTPTAINLASPIATSPNLASSASNHLYMPWEDMLAMPAGLQQINHLNATTSKPSAHASKSLLACTCTPNSAMHGHAAPAAKVDAAQPSAFASQYATGLQYQPPKQYPHQAQEDSPHEHPHVPQRYSNGYSLRGGQRQLQSGPYSYRLAGIVAPLESSQSGPFILESTNRSFAMDQPVHGNTMQVDEMGAQNAAADQLGLDIMDDEMDLVAYKESSDISSLQVETGAQDIAALACSLKAELGLDMDDEMEYHVPVKTGAQDIAALACSLKAELGLDMDDEMECHVPYNEPSNIGSPPSRLYCAPKGGAETIDVDALPDDIESRIPAVGQEEDASTNSLAPASLDELIDQIWLSMDDDDVALPVQSWPVQLDPVGTATTSEHADYAEQTSSMSNYIEKSNILEELPQEQASSMGNYIKESNNLEELAPQLIIPYDVDEWEMQEQMYLRAELVASCQLEEEAMTSCNIQDEDDGEQLQPDFGIHLFCFSDMQEN